MTSPVPQGEVNGLVSLLAADLSYLFDDASVDTGIQAKFSEIGYRTVRIFSRIAETIPEFKEVLKNDITLDPGASPANRLATANLINCWEAARTRNEMQLKQQAEQKVNDLPIPISRAQHLVITSAFHHRHRELTEKESPSPSLVEALLEQVEQGEIVAEKLSTSMSKESSSGEPFGACKVQPDGTIKFSKGKAESTMPNITEQLRARYKLLARAWEFVRIKLPTKTLPPGLRDDGVGRAHRVAPQ